MASCRLADCVPIVTYQDDEWLRCALDHLDRVENNSEPTDLLPESRPHLIYTRDRPTTTGRALTSDDITDQLPFGDFSPGRFAWLLEDVKSTTERCPRCRGCGRLDEEFTSFTCPTCEGTGRGCAPVPMRGRQGLWPPRAEDWGRAA